MYRGTLLIRNRPALGPYGRPVLRVEDSKDLLESLLSSWFPPFRGTSLIRQCCPVGPYHGVCPPPPSPENEAYRCFFGVPCAGSFGSSCPPPRGKYYQDRTNASASERVKTDLVTCASATELCLHESLHVLQGFLCWGVLAAPGPSRMAEWKS